MRIVTLALVGSVPILFSSACAGPASTTWNDEGGFRWRRLDVGAGDRTGFSPLPPSRTGITFVNPSGESRPQWSSHLGHGSGVALGDVDGDGLTDIYLTSIDRSNVLYRNLGNWRFEDITQSSRVAAPDRASSGSAFADVDGDGDLDLLVTALGGPNALFRNDGTGSFTDVTEEAGLGSDRASGTMALADVDGDADLDLYVSNYRIQPPDELFDASELTFDSIVARRGDRFEIRERFREHYRLRELPELGLVSYATRAQPDWFYLNDGAGRFQSVPFTSDRFLDEDGNPFAEEPDYFSLAARFYDVDGDGDPDLYVCNDFDDPDLFWINDGTGRFRAAPRTAVRSTSNATMAVDFSDIDRDGDVDFFATDMLGRDSRRRKAQRPSYAPLPKLVGEIENRPQVQRNTLQLNRGDATFAQIAEYAGVEASDWTWATMFLDVDLDGYEDILVTTGHLWDQFDEDRLTRIARMPMEMDWTEERRLFPTFDTPNVIYRNRGDLTFEEMGDEWGFSGEPDISHGPAAGDLDGDGDLDVVINRLGSPPAVLRNESTRPRIAVILAGEPPNTQGIGAKIRVLGGPVPVQEKEVTLGGMYLSSSAPQYTFATGDAAEVEIHVEWRSGRSSAIRGARPNRLYEVRESRASPSAPKQTLEPRGTMFADVSAELNHVHAEERMDDYIRQPLLPNKLSQLGPGVTWYDVDADGDEDLIIPSGRSGPLAIYDNDRGRLSRLGTGLPAARYDQTTVLGISEGSGNRILVGQAIYEAENPADAFVTPSVQSFEIGAGRLTPEVPGTNSSAGPLALSDVDGDHDLDLFVGGRVIPGAYPMAASSRLFRNDGGRFVPDSVNAAALSDVGLVSAAVYSDVDADGDPDLLLAMEWGPVRLFVNDDGRLTEATGAWDLARYTSRWNGITSGDLDGNGLPDVVATSWGSNTKHGVTEARPLLVYYADFDRNGSLDVLLSQYDDVISGIAPLMENRNLLIRALPFAARTITNATDYSNATVEEVLGERFADAARLSVSGLEHLVFVNRGDRFEAVPLPGEAQFAPAFYAGVADFDGDGNEDVFLTQNFFPTELATPRYDAGRGLLLLGDGHGALSPVPGQVSGIEVYGDSRGAAFADYNADGRTDLVISQNGAATKLYRNDGGAIGLRVRLIGPAANRDAIGAAMRLVYEGSRGPLREVHAGSGYWSQDGALQVLGNHATARAVWVRWPDGSESETPLESGSSEITIRYAR